MISGSIPNDSEDDQFFKSMLTMVSFGFGEIFGCFFIGQIVDRVGSKKAVFVNVGILIVMMGFTFGFLFNYEYGVLCFLMAFYWGF